MELREYVCNLTLNRSLGEGGETLQVIWAAGKYQVGVMPGMKWKVMGGQEEQVGRDSIMWWYICWERILITFEGFSSCVCLDLSSLNFRDATNALEGSIYVGNRELNSWITVPFMVVLVGNWLSSWQDKAVCCNFAWTNWMCLIWLVCTFALDLVLLETQDLLPVQMRCAYSFSSACGAQERTVWINLLLVAIFPDLSWDWSPREWNDFL